MWIRGTFESIDTYLRPNLRAFLTTELCLRIIVKKIITLKARKAEEKDNENSRAHFIEDKSKSFRARKLIGQ